MGGLLLLLRIEEKELFFWDLRLNHGERRGSRLDFASVLGGGGGDTDAIVWEGGFDVSTFRELEGALGLVLSFSFFFFVGDREGAIGVGTSFSASFLVLDLRLRSRDVTRRNNDRRHV